MNHRSLLASTSALAIALTVFAAPRVADACAPLTCAAANVAPKGGATIPASATAFPITLSRLFYDADAGSLSEGLALHAAGGAVVPTTLEADATKPWEVLLRPVSPLTPGEYTIAYRERCEMGSPMKEQSFTVSAAAPLPTTIGTVALGARTTIEGQMGAGGSCEPTYPDESGVWLDIKSSAELTPYLPVTTWTTKVDGKDWAKSTSGAIEAGASADPVAKAFAPSVRYVFAKCGTQESPLGLAPGKHTITVSAQIAGATTPLPELSIDADITCPATAESTDMRCSSSGGACAGGAFGSLTAGLFAALLLGRRRRHG